MSQTVSRTTFQDIPVPHALDIPQKVRGTVDQLGEMFRHVLEASPGVGLSASISNPGGLWYLSAASSMADSLSDIPSSLGAMVTHHATGLRSTGLGLLFRGVHQHDLIHLAQAGP